MHLLNGFSDGLNLLVVKENGLRQLEFQDFVRYFKAGCDSPKGIQEIGIPEMLAGQAPSISVQTSMKSCPLMMSV